MQNQSSREEQFQTSTGMMVDICFDEQISSEINFADWNEKEGGLWVVKDANHILCRLSLVLPIVLLGVSGNLAIIYSMLKNRPFKSRPTYVFILNMAIADLISTIVSPNVALFTDIYQFYMLGSFICRIEGFIRITCLLVSSYSLIVLSISWRNRVVQPCASRITREQSWLSLILIWVISIVMASPLIMARSLKTRVWKDSLEIWCCELVQDTKYYWICVIFPLIYLPTIIMTVVLVIILDRMNKFEAKLRQSVDIPLDNSNSSSMNMRYRRNIVTFLITYLLITIVCWTPLQFFTIYRFFRTSVELPSWFKSFNFYVQLSASLAAALDPLIFGFFDENFRKMLTSSWLFKLAETRGFARVGIFFNSLQSLPSRLRWRSVLNIPN